MLSIIQTMRGMIGIKKINDIDPEITLKPYDIGFGTVENLDNIGIRETFI